MGYEMCFRCGDQYEAGYADPHLPYGSLVPFCMDCNNTVIEDFLWDVSTLSERDDLTFYPHMDGEEWVIRNRYGDLDDYVAFMNETSNMEFDRDELDLPEEDVWEIFVSSKENEEAIEEAREHLRKMNN